MNHVVMEKYKKAKEKDYPIVILFSLLFIIFVYDCQGNKNRLWLLRRPSKKWPQECLPMLEKIMVITWMESYWSIKYSNMDNSLYQANEAFLCSFLVQGVIFLNKSSCWGRYTTYANGFERWNVAMLLEAHTNVILLNNIGWC